MIVGLGGLILSDDAGGSPLVRPLGTRKRPRRLRLTGDLHYDMIRSKRKGKIIDCWEPGRRSQRFSPCSAGTFQVEVADKVA